MLRSTLLAALALLASGPAAAQAGRYSVSGTNPGGSGGYSGALTVSTQGEAYRVVWETGGAPIEGIGVVVNDVLATAYGGDCGIVAYTPADDGYEAVWAAMGGRALGTEHAEETGPEGAYAVSGTNPGSEGVYTGTLVMADDGNATAVRWDVGGSVYTGIGLAVDDVLGVAYGAETCGVAVYRMAEGALDGVWTAAGASGIGTETATPY
ncbi:MAG TPA: hypothetical protein VGB53_16170 [Rubricoccaceae bacterium]|jgi:hypothetical protein